MPLFGSESSTTNKSTTITEDRRNVVDADGRLIQSEGGAVNIVADEAFELGDAAIRANAGVTESLIDRLFSSLDDTQDFARSALDKSAAQVDTVLARERSEGAQLGEMVVKIGLPVLALIAIFRGKLPW